ncbi:MAG: twin-arginine translocase TatA/TatE family subunit [Alphaproteobacteria bacterium]|nr:twin-arginine translocase TatA/TatE family subunit [Alphaproteobacteria bacterium]
MGSFSIWHWLIVLAVILLLFGGRGKIPSLMGDIAKGIKSFKTNMKPEDQAAENPQLQKSDAPAGKDETVRN